MEKWIDRFSDMIPYCGHEYYAEVKSGDTGLFIELEYLKDEITTVTIDFDFTDAVQIVEEGYYLNNHFRDPMIEKYKESGFESVIYEIVSGEFGKFLNYNSGGLSKIRKQKHFVIVTLNYVIEIISLNEPVIKVNN